MRGYDDRRGIRERSGGRRVFRNRALLSRSRFLRDNDVYSDSGASRRRGANARQYERGEPSGIRQSISSGGRGDDGKRRDSAVRDDGGSGHRDEEHHGRGTAVRSRALPYRDIRSQTGRKRTCGGEYRHGALHSGDARCRMPVCGSGSYVRSVCKGGAAFGGIRVDEPASRRGSAGGKAGTEQEADIGGGGDKRGDNSRTSRSDMRSASACARLRNAADVACGDVPPRIRALLGVSYLFGVHDDDRRAEHRAGEGKSARRRGNARRRACGRTVVRNRV